MSQCSGNEQVSLARYKIICDVLTGLSKYIFLSYFYVMTSLKSDIIICTDLNCTKTADVSYIHMSKSKSKTNLLLYRLEKKTDSINPSISINYANV